LSGAASLSWGVTEIIAGFQDEDLSVPKPTIPVMAIMAATGDLERACELGIIEDSMLLGAGAGSMAGRVATNQDIFGLGVDFLNTAIQTEIDH
jgi:hypothetical protein